MDISGLNEQQRKAVLKTDGPVMILAGAGSGKTKTLVTRIAYLLEELHVSPFQVLALTFSNKAAREMRERISTMVEADIGSLQITTFHAFCARILRSEANYLGLSKNFTIYDTSEQKAVAKAILGRHGISTKEVSPFEILYYMDDLKNHGHYPGRDISECDYEIDESDSFFTFYQEYEAEIHKANAVDFGSLITGVVQLFEKFPEVLKRYQERFKYLLVDEYQDTNRAQFELVKMLSEKSRNVCVVGDEDQSIYSWRGADMENILKFHARYPEATTYKIEMNYRSQPEILELSNAAISANTEQIQKELRAARDGGEMVPALVKQMGQAYPELGQAQSLIEESLLLEETRFKTTLDRGLKLLDDEMTGLPENAPLPGAAAFKLYDTFGFPKDLTALIAADQGKKVDFKGFEKYLAEQKDRSRKDSKKSMGDWIVFNEGDSTFIGYDEIECQTEILRYRPIEQKGKKLFQMVLAKTPFYGESGGQVGDVGELTTETGATIEIVDTQKKLNSMHVHIGKVTKGSVAANDVVQMNVDVTNRNKIRANHSVTHILHAALRNNLGDQLTQKGSLVAADKMRFDVSHSKAVTREEIRQVEDEVNSIIRQNSEVTTRLMTPEEAIEAGAMALFGEKYGDEVRVVAMGTNLKGLDYSVELCGGTHVKRTGDIGYFKIVSEGAVSSGVRRLEVLTGNAAVEYSAEQEKYLAEAALTIKTPASDLKSRLNVLISERKNMEKEIAELQKKVALGGGNGSSNVDDIVEIDGVKFLGQVLEGIQPRELRGLADEAKGRLGSGVVAFVAVNDGKAAVLTAVTNDLVSKISAVDLVKVGAEALGGKGGGGRPDMAQAGGPNGSNANDAIQKIINALK